LVVRRRQGPTKKLAPTSAPEHACAHSYRDDEGLQLEVDCTDCNGAHDLNNRKCLAGVLNALVSASPPESIVLKRYIDKRYRGDSVAWIATCAGELSLLNRLVSAKNGSSDKRCRTCLASRVNVLDSARRALLDDPATYLNSPRDVFKEIRERMLASAGRCAEAPVCVDEVLASIGLESGDGSSAR
jgi:hypothetical protein